MYGYTPYHNVMTAVQLARQLRTRPQMPGGLPMFGATKRRALPRFGQGYVQPRSPITDAWKQGFDPYSEQYQKLFGGF